MSNQTSVSFLAANIAKTDRRSLHFSTDARSKRAEHASRQAFNAVADVMEHDVLFQIISLENISVSKAAQLDELLSLNDMESVGADRLRYSKQRAINNVNVTDDDNTNLQQQQDNFSSVSNINNFFKLTLQDCSGNLVYAIELEKLPFLSGKNHKSGFPIQLGSKLIVRQGSAVVQGVILLDRNRSEYLGGIVPEWNHKDLNKAHIEFLRRELQKLPGKDDKKKK